MRTFRTIRQTRQVALKMRPSADQPGTLEQQLQIIDCYLANPYRSIDKAAAWDVARRLVLSHARRAGE